MLDKDNQEIFSTFQENVGILIRQAYEATEEIRQALQKHAKELLNIPDSNRLLANHGWYLPFEFNPPEINYLVAELRKGNFEFVENAMVEHLDSTINKIELELINRFPNRKAALNAGIKAHINQEYYLSVPVFLAQIEGMCNELTGMRFFKSKNKIPLTASWADNFSSNSVIGILLEPLKVQGAVRQNENSDQSIGFNRHEILHGMCNDYGENKVNSYKVLSLLNYIGETAYEAKKELESKYNCT